MKKSIIAPIIILVVVVGGVSAGVWYFVSHKGSRSIILNGKDNKGDTSAQDAQAGTSGSNNVANPGAAGASGTSSSQALATKDIAITGTAFSPNTLTVHKGAAVTWTNNDTAAHAIAMDDSSAEGPHSPQLQPSDSYSYSFSHLGTYHYKCVLQPGLTGTITVIE